MTLARWVLLSVLAVATGTAFAQEATKWPGGEDFSINPVLTERFTLHGGAAFNTVDATVGSRSTSTGMGQDIDLDDLGVSGDDASPLIGGRFRFGAKRQFTINLSYFGTDAAGVRALDQPFAYEGVRYNVGATVRSELNTDLLVGMFGWAPLKTDKYELGIGIGAHVADLEVKFEGAGRVDGVAFASVTAKSDTLAPLPNFWAYGSYAFTPKLSLQASLGYLSLDIDKYDGSIGTIVGTIEYRVRERIGFGAGYRYIDTELTVDNSDYKDKYDVDYYGPFVYMSLGF